VQWTVGILRHFRAFSTPEQNLGLGVLSTPAPPPLTQTVRRIRAKCCRLFVSVFFVCESNWVL